MMNTKTSGRIKSSEMNCKIRSAIFNSINCLLFLTFLFNTVEISANAGPPSQGGYALIEPSGLENIYITRETLTIDMRPLGLVRNVTDEKIVLVEAIYSIENRGEEKRLDLIFAIGSENIDDFQFWIDDKLISKTEFIKVTNSQQINLPESWQPPKTTPWHPEETTSFESQKGNLTYYPLGVESIAFALTIPAGKHTLKAKYKSEATEYFVMEPLKAWQFAYILAPAREWADFGGLDITVYIPEGWDTVTSPQLKFEDGVWRGSFDEIPADSLAITTRSTLPGSYSILRTFGILFLLSVIFAFPILLIRSARRKSNKTSKLWLYGLGWGILWAVLFFSAGFLTLISDELTIPAGQIAIFGYEGALIIISILVISPIFFVIGFSLWMGTNYLARERKTIK